MTVIAVSCSGAGLTEWGWVTARSRARRTHNANTRVLITQYPVARSCICMAGKQKWDAQHFYLACSAPNKTEREVGGRTTRRTTTTDAHTHAHARTHTHTATQQGARAKALYRCCNRCQRAGAKCRAAIQCAPAMKQHAPFGCRQTQGAVVWGFMASCD